MSQAAADRNLLFGILALQMDFIRRDALIAAMNAWVLDKAKPLGQILLDQGALTAGDHQLLEALVQRHLEKHGQDVERSLAALDASQAVRQDLHRIADEQLHASLAQLPKTPSAAVDSLSTTGPVCAEGARFRIVRPHARGGLGEVFVARDGELNREVALKAIQAEHADHPESRLRFVREAEITGGLEHPGIVPVYALGHYADGRPYYAMRFIKGDSLKQAIERFHSASLDPTRHNLQLRQLLNRFIAVCNAIAYAHSRGVIHRDLKPSNIMLGEFGETLVVDWGLAKAVGRGYDGGDQEGKEPHLERTTDAVLSPTDSELTRSGQALGTPAYMSPEQAAGRLDLLGPASDVYSLGATLYTLLTGQAPFAKSDIGEVLNKVQKGDFAPPRQVSHQVPAALEAICLKAMALQPQARYASAKALADDVEHWLADEAVTAHAEPWSARLGRWVRHHKGLVGSVAAIVAVGLTVAIASWLVRTANDRQKNEQVLRGIAEDERAEAEKQKGDAHLQRAEAEKQKGEADLQRAEAEKQRQLANRYLYFSRINLAHWAWQENNIRRMDELLEQTRPQHTEGEDLGGFERAYLARLRQESLLTLKGHTGGVWSVAFSPDGQRLASASGRQVKVWDTRSGQEALTLKGHTGRVSSVAFSPDGQRLASASYDKTVKVWDARSGQVTLTLKGHTSWVSSMAFSPDGQRLASASRDGTVKVWDARTGQVTLTLKGHTIYVTSVAFSPDDQHLASASGDNTVKVWDARSGQVTLTLKASYVTSVAFSADGQRLASASQDSTVRVWDAHSGQENLTLKEHTGSVSCVAFSPDGQRLASASHDGTVKVWDARSGQVTLTLKGHTNIVWSVAFSPDGQRLASASADNMVKVWDARGSQENLTFKGHMVLVSSVAFSPDGQRLASASRDGMVKVWDARSGQETLTLQTNGGSLVAFSSDGQRLASDDRDGTVTVWDARTGQERLTLKGHTNIIWSLAFSPDGQRLATASEDGTVKVWDARTGQENLTLKGHTSLVNGVAFSPDGQCLASASNDQTVKVWDARTGQKTLTLKVSLVHSVAFSPDGQRLASARGDGTVKLWDAHSGQESLTLKGHTGDVFSVAFSPDGQRLASASADNTVKVWDARTGQETLTLKGHTGGVFSVAFSPDGQRLASPSADNTVKVWDAAPVSKGSNLQRQALSYFRFVAETIVLKDEMIQQIHQTPTLSEPAREQALAFAKDYREIPDRLNDASRLVVRGSWAQPGVYALALRQAQAAFRYEPDNSFFLTTLGAAHYRNQKYDVALKMLTHSAKLNAVSFKRSVPADLAFLAMTQLALGKKADAVATLGRLRDTMKKLPFDREAEDLLHEAERLVEAKK